MRKAVTKIILAAAVFAVVLTGCGSGKIQGELDALQQEYDSLSAGKESLQKEFDALKEEKEKLEKEMAALQKEKETLAVENEELKNGPSAQIVKIRNAWEGGRWQEVIDLAGDLHQRYNGCEEDKEGQDLAGKAGAKLEEARAKKAEEEAKGYETGITYDQLARTPDKYEGSKVKFYGEVIQVIEGDGSVQIRLAVEGDYDHVVFCQYDSGIVSSRVLEDDKITVYGVSAGTISYQSTMGGQITIPAVLVEKIDQ